METGKKAGTNQTGVTGEGKASRVTGRKTISSVWDKLTLTRRQDRHVEISRWCAIWGKDVLYHLRQFYFHSESEGWAEQVGQEGKGLKRCTDCRGKYRSQVRSSKLIPGKPALSLPIYSGRRREKTQGWKGLFLLLLRCIKTDTTQGWSPGASNQPAAASQPMSGFHTAAQPGRGSQRGCLERFACAGGTSP